MQLIWIFDNIPLISEEELEQYFGKIGEVSLVHLVIDKRTKRSKGIAYVLYTHPEFAARYAVVLEACWHWNV